MNQLPDLNQFSKNRIRKFLLRWEIVVLAALIFVITFSLSRDFYVALLVGFVTYVGHMVTVFTNWRIAVERAWEAKKKELDKWDFYSRDRDRPWLVFIEKPVVYATERADNMSFYSEWLVIEQGRIIVNPGESTVTDDQVAYQLSNPRTYAWDGSTPKLWIFWLLLIGIPDWWRTLIPHQSVDSKGRLTSSQSFEPITSKATLIHDALYQYLQDIPMAQKEADSLFREILIENGFPRWLASVYYHVVVRLSTKVDQTGLGQPSRFQCNTFNQLH